MTLDDETAQKVILAAKKYGISESEMPETEKDRIGMANEFVQLALQARENGNDREPVRAVLSCLDEQEQEEKPQEDFEIPEEEIQDAIEDRHEAFSQESIAVEVIDEPKDKVTLLGLPVPELPEEMRGNVDPLPSDITKVDDTTVRRLHWQRHVLDVYAARNLVVEESDARDCRRIATRIQNVVMRELEEDASKNGIERTQKSLIAEAQQNEEYRLWEDKAERHEQNAREIRQLVEHYRADVAVLSREMSMRNNQREAAGEVGIR
jgi:hypothetical protein